MRGRADSVGPGGARSPLLFKWLVGGLPFALALAVGLAVALFYLRSQQPDDGRGAPDELVASLRKPVSAGDLEAYMRIMRDVFGARVTAVPDALEKTANYLESTLGPRNIGYEVERIDGPDETDTLIVRVRGRRGPGEALLVSVDYSAGGEAGRLGESSSAVAAFLSLANAFTGAELNRPVVFVAHAGHAELAKDRAGGARATLDLDARLHEVAPRMGLGAEGAAGRLADWARDLESEILRLAS